MKIRVSGVLLNEKLSSISKIFDRLRSDDVKSNIKISVYIDMIRLQAMNERIAFTETIDGVYTDVDESNQGFSFLVNAKTLIDFFRTHQSDVEIEVKNDFELSFSYKRGSFYTTWGEDKIYPEFFYPKSKTDVVVLKSSSFVSSLKRSFSFVSVDEFRPALSAVYLNIKKEYIDIVSTDLFRLFVNRNNIVRSEIEKGVMLSEMAASILYLYLSDSDTDHDISICSDDVRTFIMFDNVIISDMNYEEKFPDYERVCSKMVFNHKIVFDKDQMVAALNSVSMVNDLVGFKYDSGSMIVKSEDKGNRKQCTEIVDASTVSNNGFSFFISRGNILSSIKSMIKGEVALEYSDEFKSLKLYNTKYENTFVFNQTLSNYNY